MNIVALPAFDDNYIWLLQHGGQTVCVDPGDAAPVRAYLAQHGLQLNAVWLTHHHGDHTGGVAELKQQFPDCTVYGHAGLDADIRVGEGSHWQWQGAEVTVWHVPGHTARHVVYILKQGQQTHVFCGDTLFSAGCGRVFDGTAADLYRSLMRLNTLPENTLFYPAHEYTASNLRFAQAVEPDNADVAAAVEAAAHTPTLPVTLAHERRINPFLRVHLPAVQAAARQQDAAAADGAAVFAALRQWKNIF
ncbi:hydroxyacylglutathione hydrolase [Neisseria sp. HSC-16F19]|nr:hydroxyacylglutathione hydrolase [Neisseria sp. HSC-16F19]MCP2039855.1 hydroxyacylglutathione hydrolase [Neisseria sp. HSC-16F19]